MELELVLSVIDHRKGTVTPHNKRHVGGSRGKAPPK